MYHLSLFGSVRLSGPSGPLDGRVSQRRPLALLSLLATCEDGLLSRDKLVGYLWPDTESARARHRLSVTLHPIRKALGKTSILTRGDDLQLNSEVLSVDVREFEAALEEGETARAVELYAGPFMDGFYLDGAPAFERWQQAERRRSSRRYAEALESLAEQREAAGDVRRALELWRRLAEHQPYSSRVALRLIRALEAAGDRPAAVRHARIHGAAVRAELGVEPDPEVPALADALENGEVAREAERPAPTEPAVATSITSDAGSVLETSSGGAEIAGEAREAGSRAARGRRPSRGAVGVAVASVLVLVGVLGFLALPDDETVYDSTRVLVDLFANRTGDPELEELGRMATDWIAQGLTYTGFVDVVTLGTPILAGQGARAGSDGDGGGEGLERIARDHGTGTLVSGSYYRSGDSVYFQAHVTDARDRRELASLEPVAAAVEVPVPGLEKLRDRVMAALATLTDPRLARWQRNASKPPSFEAYRTFVEGLELQTTHHRAREAARRFREAKELDAGFTMAKLWEAMSLRNARLRDEADSLLAELSQDRQHLAPLDRAFLDYQVARSDGDAMAMLRAARRMAEIAPGSEYLKLAGHSALLAGRPAEAVRHYERADPESGWLRGWSPYWARLAAAHHRLGNLERMLEVARRGRSRYPDNAQIREQELRALAALGRIEELERQIAELRALDSPYTATALAYTAEELGAHGYEELSRKLFRESIAIERKELAEGSNPRGSRIALSFLFQTVGDLDAANEHVEVLLAEHPDDYSVLHSAALLRAREGRREMASEFVRRMEGLRGDRLPGARAEVAAVLGERDRAVRLLKELRTADLFYYRHSRAFRSLRDHPPFEELVRPKG